MKDKILQIRIQEYLLEASAPMQEQCYASYHDDAKQIIEDCVKIIERMKYIHAWCQCNIELKTSVSRFAKEIRNAIEDVGIESSKE